MPRDEPSARCLPLRPPPGTQKHARGPRHQTAPEAIWAASFPRVSINLSSCGRSASLAVRGVTWPRRSGHDDTIARPSGRSQSTCTHLRRAPVCTPTGSAMSCRHCDPPRSEPRSSAFGQLCQAQPLHERSRCCRPPRPTSKQQFAATCSRTAVPADASLCSASVRAREAPGQLLPAGRRPVPTAQRWGHRPDVLRSLGGRPGPVDVRSRPVPWLDHRPARTDCQGCIRALASRAPPRGQIPRTGPHQHPDLPHRRLVVRVCRTVDLTRKSPTSAERGSEPER